MNQRRRPERLRIDNWRRLAVPMLLCLAAGALGALPPGTETETEPGEIQLTQKAIYPAVRQSASPSGGRLVTVNPPPLLWPRATGKDVRYDVRLSQDPTFAADKTITSTGQPWAMFNLHNKLASGTWHWQYAVSGEAAPAWSPTHVFRVSDTTRVFETHAAQKLLAACARPHPRLLVRADNLPAFREHVKDLAAAGSVVALARK